MATDIPIWFKSSFFGAILLAMTFYFFSVAGCTLFEKHESDEMEEMTEQVLKKGQGIDIEFKPIHKDK